MEKITLPNGLKIILIPRRDDPAATIFILTKAGLEYENKNNNGISHFLEHLCFKGTKRRPSKLHIAKEFDSLGAEYNAFTSKEYTGYFAKAKNSHLDKILDIVSDIYLNSLFPEKEIEKEKGVIIEEINKYRDSPEDHIWDVFLELIYGDQPAGWNTAGTAKTVTGLKRDDFLRYHQQLYHPSNTLAAIAGNFNKNNIFRQIKKIFDPLEKKPIISKTATDLKGQKKSRVKNIVKKSEQTHIIFGFESLNLFDKRRYILDVLTTILGGGMSSRLFQKIREEKGLAYHISTVPILFIDHGLTLTACGVRNNSVSEAIKIIWEEHKKIAEKPIADEEISLAKKKIKGQLALGLETSDEIASFYGGQELLLGRSFTPEQIYKKIDSVTAKDIQKLAKDIFKKEKINIALIGPTKEKEFRI